MISCKFRKHNKTIKNKKQKHLKKYLFTYVIVKMPKETATPFPSIVSTRGTIKYQQVQPATTTSSLDIVYPNINDLWVRDTYGGKVRPSKNHYAIRGIFQEPLPVISKKDTDNQLVNTKKDKDKGSQGSLTKKNWGSDSESDTE